MSHSAPATFDVEPHLDVLRRYALVLTRSADEAEDLVQESLLRAIAGAAGWRPERGLRPWLLSVVHNAHVSRRRRRQVEQAAAGELAPVEPPVTLPPQVHRVELAQTMAALLRLPEDQREVLVLVAIEGLAYKDAAEILDLPIGTLMSRLARARAALRRAVGQNDETGPARAGLRVVR